jgi:hypothetical protein
MKWSPTKPPNNPQKAPNSEMISILVFYWFDFAIIMNSVFIEGSSFAKWCYWGIFNFCI